VRRALVLLAAAGGASGCVYYNGMWSAEHLAGEARRAEAHGSVSEARTYWAGAAVKAESVVAQHPRSRWAEPALVLEGEGLARSGACERAAAPLGLALRIVRREELRERATLALAECALDATDLTGANRRLTEVTSSRDPRRRSHAAFLAGRAAELGGDYAAAAEWYGRSAEQAAPVARARVLLAGARTAEALALLDTLAGGRFWEADWAALMDEVARAAGPDSASAALDRLFAQARVPAGAHGRLLLADGDRLLTAGRARAAGARYAAIVALVPDSVVGQQARVRALRALAAQADSLGDLVAIRARLTRLIPGAPTGDAHGLELLLRRLLDPEQVAEGQEFRTAELVRDSVGASHLAGRLFVTFAGTYPASLFAPKALVAAVALLPDTRDSLLAVLDRRYAASPYTLALRGEESPAFAAAEDSLARTLGLELAPPAVLLPVGRVAAPVPGPRGPALDPPVAASVAAVPLVRPREDSGRRPRPGAQPRDSL
jgi:hypothetical protein